MIDADRATRLEVIIVGLIGAEIMLSIAQLMWHR
jgi:uncharacterized Rmd1/YagE family protein